jgi:hypothetical protein
MRTHILANDLVLIDLDPVEHVALSQALSTLMSSIEPSDIARVLLADCEEAYEFVYSVYVLDARARLGGTLWLPFEDYGDTVATAAGGSTVLAIAYAPNGSTWCLTMRQLRFVELAIAASAERQVARPHLTLVG